MLINWIKNNVSIFNKENSKFIGCFNDSAERDLNYSGIFPTADNGSMTIALCIKVCQDVLQPFAGIQFGLVFLTIFISILFWIVFIQNNFFLILNSHECYCGDSYGKYGEVDKSECFIPCPGDVNYKCGGYRRNSIFYVGKSYSSEPFTSNNYFSNATTTNSFDNVTSETVIDLSSTTIQTNSEDNLTTTKNLFSTTNQETQFFTPTTIKNSNVTSKTTVIKPTTTSIKNLNSTLKTTSEPKTITSQGTSFKTNTLSTKFTSGSVKTNSKSI